MTAWPVKRESRGVRHAGSEVLRVTVEVPTGDTPCARHTAALLFLLAKKWEDALTPPAVAAWQQAAAAGRGCLFARHTLFVGAVCAFRKKRQYVTLLVRFSGEQGAEERRFSPMCWSADGRFQYHSPLFSKRPKT